MSESPIRILVVGSAPARFRALAATLGASGLDCEVAALPLRALGAGADRPGFDVALVPVARGGERARDTVRRVLRFAGGRPVLALTDRDGEEEALRLLQTGVDDCLATEAATGPSLARAIRRALARSHGARAGSASAPRERILFDAALALADSLDFDETVWSLTALLVPAVADWCVIDVLDEAGELQAYEARSSDGEGEEGAPIFRRYARSARDGAHPVVRVLESEKPLLLPAFPDELREEDGTGDPEGASGLGSTLAVPVVAHGRVLGVITLAMRTGRRAFARPDLEMAERLAQITAVEVWNALLYRAAQDAQARAEQATRAREEVLGFVAHDLRNPLSAAGLHIRRLLAGDLPEAERRRHVEAIRECTASMDHLIEDLLDVTRLTAGAVSLETEPLDPGALLDEVVSMLGVVADSAGITLRREGGDAPSVVFANRERVLQVFANLVGNAVKFTAPGGTIRLGAAARDDGVGFSVADSGAGIADEDLPHVFDRFWHGREDSGAGAGLGLTIARAIVEAHGGRIWAESRLGAGSVFRFTLPSVPAAAPVPRRGPRHAVSGAGSAAGEGAVRILLVDDHPMVRRGLQALLAGASGMEVAGEADTGEDGVEMALALRPDVVVMDLAMPGIGGLEAIRRIHAQLPDARILALTADSEAESLLPVLQAGGSGYVRKTTAQDDLVAAIRAAARNEVFLYPEAASVLLRGYREMASATLADPSRALDGREREILALTAEGHSAPEIGRRLHLAASTVDTYRSRLMYKLGLTHRSELVRFALRFGLLPTRRDEPEPGGSTPEADP